MLTLSKFLILDWVLNVIPRRLINTGPEMSYLVCSCLYPPLCIFLFPSSTEEGGSSRCERIREVQKGRKWEEKVKGQGGRIKQGFKRQRGGGGDAQRIYVGLY